MRIVKAICGFSTTKGIDCFRDVSSRHVFNSRGPGHGRGRFCSRQRQDGTCVDRSDSSLDAIHTDGVFFCSSREKPCQETKFTSLLEDHLGSCGRRRSHNDDLQNGRFSRVDRRDGTPIGLVVGMTEDVDNNIWIETTGPPGRSSGFTI